MLQWGSAPSVWGIAPAATADAAVLAVCARYASSIQVAREPACGDERSWRIICAPFTRGWARELLRLNHAAVPVVDQKKRRHAGRIENEADKVLRLPESGCAEVLQHRPEGLQDCSPRAQALGSCEAIKLMIMALRKSAGELPHPRLDLGRLFRFDQRIHPNPFFL